MTLNKNVFQDKCINRKIKYLSKQFSFDVCKITNAKLSEIVQSNLKDFISTSITFFPVSTSII